MTNNEFDYEYNLFAANILHLSENTEAVWRILKTTRNIFHKDHPNIFDLRDNCRNANSRSANNMKDLTERFSGLYGNISSLPIFTESMTAETLQVAGKMYFYLVHCADISYENVLLLR